MPDIFADTAGWGHLVDPSQAYHAQAATIYRNVRQQGQRVGSVLKVEMTA
jgi:hypothetical protein